MIYVKIQSGCECRIGLIYVCMVYFGILFRGVNIVSVYSMSVWYILVFYLGCEYCICLFYECTAYCGILFRGLNVVLVYLTGCAVYCDILFRGVNVVSVYFMGVYTVSTVHCTVCCGI